MSAPFTTNLTIVADPLSNLSTQSSSQNPTSAVGNSQPRRRHSSIRSMTAGGIAAEASGAAEPPELNALGLYLREIQFRRYNQYVSASDENGDDELSDTLEREVEMDLLNSPIDMQSESHRLNMDVAPSSGVIRSNGSDAVSSDRRRYSVTSRRSVNDSNGRSHRPGSARYGNFSGHTRRNTTDSSSDSVLSSSSTDFTGGRRHPRRNSRLSSGSSHFETMPLAEWISLNRPPHSPPFMSSSPSSNLSEPSVACSTSSPRSHLHSINLPTPSKALSQSHLTSSFFRPGTLFTGSQNIQSPFPVGSHFAQKSEEWHIKIAIHDISLSALTCCGTMEAINVPNSEEKVTTFFEGEILDFDRVGWETEKWDTSVKVDREHWRRFEVFRSPQSTEESEKDDSDSEMAGPSFEQIGRGRNVDDFLTDWLNDDVLATSHGGIDKDRTIFDDYIFMRWKEKFFVQAPQPNSLTIAGFYYISLKKSDGTIEGFYYDKNSKPYQKVLLRPVMNGSHGFGFSEFEFA
ncbi:vacuolar import and degradation protein-domain-containing protein [Paraphysoderma sedebokerense]|nr:vacuolar import and degradation protein-domain-containing protein [Paraphysoderma sedebokerense]